MTAVNDPVEWGFIKSMERTGTNVTGTTLKSPKWVGGCYGSGSGSGSRAGEAEFSAGSTGPPRVIALAVKRVGAQIGKELVGLARQRFRGGSQRAVCREA